MVIDFKQLQLTLEQHRFELCGSPYTWIFFTRYVLYNALDLQVQNCRYEELTVKLYLDFQLHGGFVPQPLSCARVN